MGAVVKVAAKQSQGKEGVGLGARAFGQVDHLSEGRLFAQWSIVVDLMKRGTVVVGLLERDIVVVGLLGEGYIGVESLG